MFNDVDDDIYEIAMGFPDEDIIAIRALYWGMDFAEIEICKIYNTFPEVISLITNYRIKEKLDPLIYDDEQIEKMYKKAEDKYWEDG